MAVGRKGLLASIAVVKVGAARVSRIATANRVLTLTTRQFSQGPEEILRALFSSEC